jgi:DNA topoisomerase II
LKDQVFSKEFKIEISMEKQSYLQHWSDNMVILSILSSYKTTCSSPEIKKTKGENFIQVSFSPDFSRFKEKTFSKDFMKLIERRLNDISGCNPKLNVYFNGNKIKVNNLKDYGKLLFEDSNSFLYKKLNEHWELLIGPSLKENEFTQLSFVNSIATIQGGTHVNTILYSILKLIS